MQVLEKITRMEEVKKRYPLYLPGDPSSSVYLLERGRIKLANTAASGKEVTFDILESDEVFGEFAVLEGLPRETAPAAAIPSQEARSRPTCRQRGKQGAR